MALLEVPYASERSGVTMLANSVFVFVLILMFLVLAGSLFCKCAVLAKQRILVQVKIVCAAGVLSEIL